MSERRIGDLQIAEGYCRERLAATRAELAAAQARADGYALLVGEYRAALILDGGQYGFSCKVCGWNWDRDTPERHGADCLLAADPEARAAKMLAAGEDA